MAYLHDYRDNNKNKDSEVNKYWYYLYSMQGSV